MRWQVSAFLCCVLNIRSSVTRNFPLGDCLPGEYSVLTPDGSSIKNCSDVCPAGFYCPLGATKNTIQSCSLSPAYFCPVGSSHPIQVQAGWYASDLRAGLGGGYAAQKPCLPGSYCTEGVKYLCPAGSFGSNSLETSPQCSGTCAEGYICPAGSVSARQHPCGGVDKYCPAGSGAPLSAQDGYYTYSYGGATDIESSAIRIGTSVCEPGSYCVGGLSRLCPAGLFGAQSELSSSSCSGWCPVGFYCPPGTADPYSLQCGSAAVICPQQSPSPRLVQTGYYSVGYGFNLSAQFAERICEPGFYCVSGVRLPCPAGSFGVTYGLSSQTCSGPCRAGYYCPLGSSVSDEIVCGGADRYCSEGSSNYSIVSVGFFSVDGNVSTRFAQTVAPLGSFAFLGILYPCPAGRFGAVTGLSSSMCSGLCAKGFHCPIGSASSYTHVCGDDSVFCPEGSPAPIPVSLGSYTADYSVESCPPGKYRNLSSIIVDFSKPTTPSVIPSPPTIADCVLCPVGTYKAQRGDSNSSCLLCPFDASSSSDHTQCICTEVLLRSESNLTLHFNIVTGLCDRLDTNQVAALDDSSWALGGVSSLTRFQEMIADPGYFAEAGVRHLCPGGRAGSSFGEYRQQCESPCAPGYYCPPGSVSVYANKCGDARVYCPLGSAQPVLADPGYFTNEDSPPFVRSSESQCPPGFYCVNGVRTPCPAGTYSDSPGASTPQCSGTCAAGHFCPAGSASSTQVPCGSPSVYCPPGSASPQPVRPGFYCDYGDTEAGRHRYTDPQHKTCSVELPCEPGYYCDVGLRLPCPPGTFSWRYGTNGADECNLCGAGYYCPSTLLPDPTAPPHTKWPVAPQTQAATPSLECGGDQWFCPRGSSFPQYVGGGNYSYGGTNSTRWGQTVCPPGFYCAGGIRQPCAHGRYGSSTGLAIQECSGLCPAGFYCPVGTALPLRCADNSYSVTGAWLCSPCPGRKNNSGANQMTCQNSRECCFIDEL